MSNLTIWFYVKKKNKQKQLGPIVTVWLSAVQTANENFFFFIRGLTLVHCSLWPLQLTYQSHFDSLQGAETWWLIRTCLCLHQCVSGQVKGLAVTGTRSLWNDLKLCAWDAGSQGHGLSPVPTTQCLCPPPSINRDGHSYIPPIHQSSQHIATGKKKRERAGLLLNQTGRAKWRNAVRLSVIEDYFIQKWCVCCQELTTMYKLALKSVLMMIWQLH